MEACDYDIIKKCLSGDMDAFEIIIQKYKKLIYSTAYRMMGNKEDAEDISQEAFIRIYNSLSKYNPEYKFSTWALKITTNLCLDKFRKKKGDTLPIEEQYDIKDEKYTPEEEYLNKEKQQRIQVAINKLPDKYREMIVLFHQNNLSYQEIMNITGEPLTIVKNRLYRARLMLREYLCDIGKESERVCVAAK